MEEIMKYKYLLIPSLVVIGMQLFKFIYTYFDTKKIDWTQIYTTGGMPSSHAGFVACLTAMIGKSQGIASIEFAISFVFSLIVVRDALGVRRNVGLHARILNEIINDSKKSTTEKLQEMTGHNPVQVLVGIIIGVVVGIIF